MKRAILAIFAALLLLGTTDMATADDKAGQKKLIEEERILIEKRDAVLATTGQVAADQIVTSKEMRELIRGIESFSRAKSEADYYLTSYGLTTTVVLPAELTQAVDEYWVSNSFFARDRSAKVRTYLVGLAGHDIIVQDSIILGLWQFLAALMALLASSCFVAFFDALFLMGKRNIAVFASFIASGLSAVFLWRWLFFL
ncbi:MAG: hypothetical protein HYT21_02945 [Candidatus Nealsonbacteria bacterium]|nr:hypothetical protein [Candidatus Nealsonbacteria bacterium]